jgi:hypothetical protein
MNIQSLRDEVTSAYKESFMKPEMFQGHYVEIDGDNGIAIIPLENISISLETGDDADYGELSEDDMEEVAQAYQNHFEGNAEPCFVRVDFGYIYRLSASGYMDCTDYSVAESEEKALKELLSMAE